MKIAVIGSGYVGLVSGTCFAETGNTVTCVDVDAEKVKKMQNGQVPIYEPGLEMMFHRNISEGRLQFTTSLEAGIQDADVIFLALPTPPGEDGSADLRYVLGVAEKLGPLLHKYTVIVDKSTVPVGTAEKVKEKIAQSATVEFDVVSNPEFLREGAAIDDFMKPDRVVIGVETEMAAKVMKELYAPMVRNNNPIIVMDIRSAELTKYAANAFLAVKISFMNEIANICELVGANVDNIRKGIGTDSRIGSKFLYAGVAQGGSCFPKDTQAIVKTAKEYGYEFEIVNAHMSVNEKRKTMLVDRYVDYLGGVDNLAGKTVAIWGLAFKPNTDDVREAAAIYHINQLLYHGAFVHVYDPEAIETTRKIFGDRITYADQYQVLQGADALFIITEWNNFRSPDFGKMKELMETAVIFDGRNVLDKDIVASKGFDYFSIGRP